MTKLDELRLASLARRLHNPAEVARERLRLVRRAEAFIAQRAQHALALVIWRLASRDRLLELLVTPEGTANRAPPTSPVAVLVGTLAVAPHAPALVAAGNGVRA